MNHKFLLGCLALSLVFLIACNGTGPVEEPLQLPTVVAAAETAVVEKTAVSPTEVVPTPTLVTIAEPTIAAPTVTPIPTVEVVAPTATAEPGPTRIQFDPGQIEVVINGRIDQPGHDEYVLRALAGQLMTVNIDSAHHDVRLSLFGLDDGQPLSRADTGATYWRGTLQQTQDFSLSAVANAAGVDYTMTVRVDPQPTDATVVDQAIQFALGADYASVTGMVSTAYTPDRYHLQVQAGQTMFVSVDAINSVDEPNVTIASSQFGYISPPGVIHLSQRWVGQLPASETITVEVSANQDNVDYVLDIRIINTVAEPIQFAAGATSGGVDGRVPANGVAVYALEAAAGQAMFANVNSRAGEAKLHVELADRSAYLGFFGRDLQTGWEGTLPQTGPYYLFVSSTVPQAFRLETTIVSQERQATSESCPTPAAGQMLFADPFVDFCFLFPAGLTVRPAAMGDDGAQFGVGLWGPPLNSGPEPIAVGLQLTYQEPANGRSALDVATEAAQHGGGQLAETIMVGGETAVVVRELSGLFPFRAVFLVHNDTLYHFAFVPDGIPTPITLPTLETLFDTVLTSMVFID